MIVNYPVRPEDVTAMREIQQAAVRSAKRQARIRRKERNGL